MDKDQTGTLRMPTARSQGFEEFMALIEITNDYTFDMVTSGAGPKRFAVIGEPVVAVDLINTIATPGSPTTDDLPTADREVQAWWRIEGTRVPGGDLPDIRAFRQLRTALRAVIEPLMDGRPVPRGAVADLNFFMHSAPGARPGTCGNRLRVARHYSRGRILTGLSAGVRDARGRKPAPLQVRDETP